MVSYFKTQWWRVLIALISLGFACYYAFQPAGDLSTLEGLNKDINLMLSAGTCFTGFLLWLFISIIDYYDDRLELLEKKAEKYDALCELVEALREANEVDRELEAQQDQKIKRLEDGLYDLRRKLYSDVD